MQKEYDLAVIGGGSAGMAAAKEAKVLGAQNVVCFDYVRPTVHGTKWGLGGTCVNVGCIPKKLMHYASQMGPTLHHDAHAFGWQLQCQGHDWNKMVDSVQMYIKRLNFSYRVGLRTKGVEYINALASVLPGNIIKFEKKGELCQIKARAILICVGGRPHVPADVPGARELAITSDDLFSLQRPPGKTLVVGASYIALECAGFLTELGYDTTVCVRSILLRGFDRQCAEKVGAMMEETGTKFKRGALPVSMKKEGAKIAVQFADGSADIYDTVLYAVGRRADTQTLGLREVGVQLTDEGKILTDEQDATCVPGVYAVGDCVKGCPELTPVAIRAGEMLVRRLFGKSQELMNYELIPTAVFTPFEYGSVGISEETAHERYGADNVETFIYEFPTLEIAAAHRPKAPATRASEVDVEMSANSLCKLVCRKDKDLQVVGFHFVGLNAGEVCQGYALALRCGARKSDFDATVGIHPTDAEAFHTMTITRSSGLSWVAAGGCGGGKCG